MAEDDIIAIQQVINRCSEAASRADWATAGTTFAEDGVWDTPVGCYEGREAALHGMSSTAALFDYIVQVNAPAVIDIDGDGATARSVIKESGKYKGQDVLLEVLGFFADTLVRTADGWKFKRRVFELQGMHSLPMLVDPS
jgi:hypothetical protein